MDTQNTAKPRLILLTDDQINLIHHNALQVLAKTGVRIDSPSIRRRLVEVIGVSQVNEERVLLPGELVEWAIQTAPGCIDIHDRLGNPAMRLGADRTRFGIGVTSLYYQDPLTDQLIPFQREHMRRMVQLGQSLPRFDVVSTVGIIQDVPARDADLFAALEMFCNTSKPLVILVSQEERFSEVIDLLETLHGDLAERPCVIPYFNPVTPLVLNQGTLDKMQESIVRGLPVIFSNYSLAGMSTPLTPAGTLILLLAELLAGLTIGQLIKEGAPMVLGILPAYLDLKTMINFYDPQSMLLNLACAEMMAHYDLPHCGTSGSGTGWGSDLLAAETYWMNHLTTCLVKGGLAPFVGDTLTSKAFSPTNVVYVHEIIDQALRFSQGFSLSTDDIGLEEIIQAGPNGSFLSSKLTRKFYRDAYYPSPIFPRLSLEKWEALGRPAAIDVLRRYTLARLDELTPPPDQQDLLERGEAYIARINQ